MAETRQRYVVDVFNMERLDKGNLKAFADVKVGKSLKIYGFRIIQQPNQKAWVSPPQRSYQGDDGQPRYAPIIELTGELKKAVEQSILKAWTEA